MSFTTVTIVVTDASSGAPIVGASVEAVLVPLVSPGGAPAPAPLTDASGSFAYPVLPLNHLGVNIAVQAAGYGPYLGLYRNLGLGATIPISLTPAAAPPPPPPPPPAPTVLFDHEWTGAVELALRALLASGLAGADGSNGQAVVDALNAKGGIYGGGEFQPHHGGVGYPTYGFGWFYVSYITDATAAFYQIVEFAAPPAGD